ncbi:MAG: C-terminal binding protein [Spirochaetaceae bacterium]|nr:C-terminal binding protein [Spirochaetaceae bacterium]
MRKAVITDHSFETPDVERSILDPLGCSVVSQRAFTDQDALIDLVRDADYVITQFAPVNAEVIECMQKCMIIVRYGIGVDNVDLAAAERKGIPVCNVPDYCIDEVADHAIAMILDLTRRITQNALTVRGGGWGLAVEPAEMRALKGQTVGVVAYGRIGREVALRLGPFKCRVVACDPAVDPARMEADGVEPVSLQRLYAESDIVTLHCPSTEATRRMIASDSIGAMKDGALLINVARGTLVDTAALVAALRSGKLVGAALDVTDPEPIDPGHPLVGMENVLITSHVASVSEPAGRTLRTSVANTVAAAVRGEKLPNVVNGVGA